MATTSIKNIAEAIYESSLHKTGDVLDSVLTKSVVLINNKNLLGKKNEILNELEKIINNENKIIKAKVTTIRKLDKKLQEDIEKYIKDRYKVETVILELIEDKTLLGGIKIEIGDDIINETLSNKLEQLQNYLITN